MGEWDDTATQIREFAFEGANRVLIADANRERVAWLRAAIGDTLPVEECDHSRRVFERLTADPPRILVVGSDLADLSGTVLLAHAARHQLVGAHHGPTVFLIGDSIPAMATVDEQQVPVYFRLTPALQPHQVRDLIARASQRASMPVIPSAPEDAARMRQVVEHAKRFGVQTELSGAAQVVQAAVTEVCRADRARVLYFDDDSGSLWIETKDGVEEAPASSGVAGFVVRSGQPAVLDRAAADPTYRPEVDDPAGTGNERIAMHPVRDRDRKIHAVLVAIREPSSPAFDAGDLRLLQSIADAWGPFIHQLALESEARAAADAKRGPGDDIFRQEAIAHMVRRGHEGDVVRVNPAWVSGAYWIVLVTLVAASVFSYFVKIYQYTEGPAVVKVTGRSEVIAFDGGTVTGVEVAAGQDVKSGQVLARLHDTEQAAKLRGLEAEFERKLVAYLQTPADPNVRQALGQVVSERESAQAGVNARVLRAPHDGRVKEVRVRNGQRVEAGSVVMTVARSDQHEGLSVLAFLPGSDRPRLRAHQPLRLTLPGYRGVHLDMEVHAISSEVLGATEAATRYLGERLGDSLPINGTVVVVEGRLRSASFQSDGQTYELHDGMIGRVEVQLEARSVLETVLPGVAQ